MGREWGEPYIVHRDEHLLVLYKPPGLATTAPGSGPCLVQRAQDLDPSAPRLHASSRLDAEVSGVVTFARTRVATRALLEARQAKAYHRRYVAIAPCSDDRLSDGEWTGAVGICPSDPRRRLVDGGKAQKSARTWYRFGEAAGPSRLLHMWPDTGRTHQLRVHAQAAGLPLFGDIHYSGERRWTLPSGRVVRAGRTMLHCYGVSLPRIDSEGRLELRVSPPEDFRVAWERLGGELSQLEALDNQPLQRD
jgi:23S rRNA-/tRNA-specific pseudouridylate synthase